MIISLKRHTSRNSAFRLGLNLDLVFSDKEDEDVSIRADTVYFTRTTSDERNSQGVELDLCYMYYSNPDAQVNVFFGGGPLVSFARARSERSYFTSVPGGDSEINTTESWSRSWSVGGRGLAGVEWFATKGISFHAEYRATLRYGRTRSEHSTRRVNVDDEVSGSVYESEDRDWRFDGVDVILGLSVYF
jgi:hypothetical protein